LTAFVPPPVHASGISGQGTWETTLQARDLDGNTGTIEAYYDTDLNITWLADANYAGTGMNWSTATAWAAGLTIGSTSGWRLPTVTDTGTSGCDYAYTGTDCGYNANTATGEMAHMFYTTLGDKAFYNTSGVGPQSGWGLTNTGPFSNVQSYPYWSATEYSPNTTASAWFFYFYDGSQGNLGKSEGLSGWAVHSGNVGAAIVPVPAAVWLFGGGLLGLIGVARKRRR
jgi:hypothetical protein